MCARKKWFKLELLVAKYNPAIISLILMLDVLLSYFNIHTEIISYLAGTSVLTIIPMLIASKVYNLCLYHKMFIYYIIFHNVLAWADGYFHFNISDDHMSCIYMFVIGVLLFTVFILRNYTKKKELL